MKRTLALVGIVKNETRYILEWIAYYRSIGIDDIVLYDNDTDEIGRELLEKLARVNIITLVSWPTIEGVSPQLSAFRDAVSRLTAQFEFLAFFDADEFLSLAENVDLRGWLSELPMTVGAIAVNQHVFGSSGLKNSSDELVTERFIRASEHSYSENQWVKSIYRSDCIQEILGPHRGLLKRGDYLLPDQSEAFPSGDRRGLATKIDFSIMKLNHYIIKSFDEFLVKRERGGGAGATLEQRLARYEDLNFFHGRDANINKQVDLSLANKRESTTAEIIEIRNLLGELDLFP